MKGTSTGTSSWYLGHRLGAILASLLFSQLPQTLANETPPIVKFKGTEVVGTSYKYLGAVEQEFFGGMFLHCLHEHSHRSRPSKGIPYAEPPVNHLRFAPPVPKYTLDTPTFDATQYGLPCPQLGVSYLVCCRMASRVGI